MLEVSKISISQKFSSKFLFIEFEINNTMEDINEYQFDILRSDAYNGKYEVVASDVKNFCFKDYSVNLINPTIEYFYKIRIIDKVTNEISESDVKKLTLKSDDNYITYLNYINNKYLNDVIADDKLKLLKRKRFGTYCECYDDVREKSSKANCTMCYGTKFTGGYFPPIDISVNYLNSPNLSEELDVKGISQVGTPVQFWTTSFPIIHQGDIIVLPDNSRCKVVSWANSEKNNVSLRQMVTIQKIPESDVIYKYPIEEE